MSSNSNALQARLLEILTDLVSIPTAYPPGDSTRICAYASEILRRSGYQTATYAEKSGLDNVVASLGEGAPHLVFNAHVDTVGPGNSADWKTDPYVLTVIGDRLHGLGASNCKGSMAVQLWLAEEIARRGGPKKGTVTFTFVTDEESLGPSGMDFLRRTGKVKPDMLLLGAPTSNTLVTAERGVMWAAIETYGHAAHAGTPEMGDNAILRMIRLLSPLIGKLIPAIEARGEGALRSTINLGQVHGGENTNVVPNYCRVEIDRRLLPTETVEDAFLEIQDVLHTAGEREDKWRVELMRGTNGFSCNRDGFLIRETAAAIHHVTGQPAVFSDAVGASDGRHFARDGIEILNFGPGAGTEGHAANEFVPINELVDSAHILETAFDRICGFTKD